MCRFKPRASERPLVSCREVKPPYLLFGVGGGGGVAIWGLLFGAAGLDTLLPGTIQPLPWSPAPLVLPLLPLLGAILGFLQKKRFSDRRESPVKGGRNNCDGSNSTPEQEERLVLQCAIPFQVLIVECGFLKDHVALRRRHGYICLVDVTGVDVAARQADGNPVSFHARVDEMIPGARVGGPCGQTCKQPGTDAGEQPEERCRDDVPEESSGEGYDLAWRELLKRFSGDVLR